MIFMAISIFIFGTLHSEMRYDVEMQETPAIVSEDEPAMDLPF